MKERKKKLKLKISQRALCYKKKFVHDYFEKVSI